uniref:Lysine exporter protein (LYSE/YGGA) n=1 Tax=Nitratidesulfovibrio vulgaris (strain DSM 19637 / Miyazaki F) TaxID=883 RepID=B8DPA5_NITV9
MEFATLAAMSTYAIAMSVTPGPNNTMVMSSGLTFGFWRTMPHLMGISLGFPLMIISVGLGMDRIFAAVPQLHDWLRWVGSAYLLWLSWRIATAAPPTPGEAAKGRNAARPMTFIEGALFQWVNPKAWLAAVAGVTTYVSGHGGSESPLAANVLGLHGVSPELLALTAVFAVMAFPSVAIWCAGGTALRGLLHSPVAVRWCNVVMGALLAISVFSLF